MKKVLASSALITFLCGCAMFGAWKTIPAPGGCDKCHTQPIGGDWQVTITPAIIHDEIDENPWQKQEAAWPEEPSPLEEKKITEQRCFRCHKGPNKAHTEHKGRYHH